MSSEQMAVDLDSGNQEDEHGDLYPIQSMEDNSKNRGFWVFLLRVKLKLLGRKKQVNFLMAQTIVCVFRAMKYINFL